MIEKVMSREWEEGFQAGVEYQKKKTFEVKNDDLIKCKKCGIYKALHNDLSHEFENGEI